MDDHENGSLTGAEKAVLQLADQMLLTNNHSNIDRAVYDCLSAHFSDAEICELGTVMAVIAGMAKLAFLMHLVEREDYCAIGADAA